MSDEHDSTGGTEQNATGGGAVGEAADGVAAGLSGISSALGNDEDTKDVREGLNATSEAAKAVGDGARAAEGVEGAVQGFQNGEIGDGIGGIGNAVGGAATGVGSISSGLSHVVSDPETRRTLQEVATVANTVGQYARDIGEALDKGIDFIANLIGEAADVDYHLQVSDLDADLEATAVGFNEQLSELYDGSITARTTSPLEESDLIGKDVHLSIERGGEQRSLRGIVSTASVRRMEEEGHGGYVVSLEVVPAMHLMAHTVDSRIYQDLTVPDLVEQLVEELVGSRNRKVKKDELTETYPQHEYLVQHRESHVEFLTRLCNEEGIYFYFDHDEEGEDHEVLVLADSNDNRPIVRESFDGRVQFTGNGGHNVRHEVATRVHRRERIGATDAVVSGYDWSNPAMQVRQEKTQRGRWSGPPLEVHDHFAHVRHHDYDDGGGQYQGHSAERQARMRTERLDVERQGWSIETTVVSAIPGSTFTLEGSDAHDGEYLITAVVAHGQNNTSGIGNYRNTLTVIPKSMPFRPPMPRRRPMPGPETATVVGPSGEEIHTDQHGRIKVQFHWDRRGQRDEHSSAWVRVVQGWAGPGWGMMFIPRIGMEVLVNFLGGDPDRPIVTGCIYNGQNRAPYPLPDDKTKSTIKTNSSIGGGGYNELRFEDKKGSEEVWIHAQKDFNEVVEHNHSTHVKNDQSNTVDHDQTETIGNDQTLHVKNNRTKTVDVDEKNTIKGNRMSIVGESGGDESLWVHGKRTVQVDGSEDNCLVTTGNKWTDVAVGYYDITTTGRFKVLQNLTTHFELKEKAYLNTPGDVQIKSGDGAVHYNAGEDGTANLTARRNIELKSKNGMIVAEAPLGVNIAGRQRAYLTSDTEIYLAVGESTIKLSPSGIEIAGPAIKINATSTTTDINAATQVRIKPE